MDQAAEIDQILREHGVSPLKQTSQLVASNGNSSKGAFKFKTDFNFGFIDDDSSLELENNPIQIIQETTEMPQITKTDNQTLNIANTDDQPTQSVQPKLDIIKKKV